MEFMSESERFEYGGLARECDAALVVAALQALFLFEKNNEIGGTENGSTTG